MGTYFTLLLAVLFTPTILILQKEMSVLLSGNELENDETQRKFLKENGLSMAPLQQVKKLLAILAPILTGWLGEPIAKALGSL